MADPAPEDIRRLAAEILRDPKFQLEPDPGTGAAITNMMEQLLEWLRPPLHWLLEVMEGLPAGLRWMIVIGLLVLLTLLVGHLVITLSGALKTSGRRAPSLADLSQGSRIDAGKFEQLAEQAVLQHDYISAVRFLFKASLAQLQAAEGKTLSPGLTNRQYVRRYQKSSFVESLRYFVDLIDTRWYGNAACGEAEYLKCREAYAEIGRQAQVGIHADTA